jgi:hypothetical protein
MQAESLDIEYHCRWLSGLLFPVVLSPVFDFHPGDPTILSN